MSNKLKLDREDKIYLEKLKEYQKHVDDTKAYSIQRFDIIIILVSTSGIYVILNFIDSILQAKTKLHCFSVELVLFFLKLSVNLFIIGIVSNLISQRVAWQSSALHRNITERKIFDLEYKGEHNAYTKETSKATSIGMRVGVYNKISLLSLTIAVTIILIIFWVVL
jgi:hypothetical protein